MADVGGKGAKMEAGDALAGARLGVLFGAMLTFGAVNVWSGSGVAASDDAPASAAPGRRARKPRGAGQ